MFILIVLMLIVLVLVVFICLVLIWIVLIWIVFICLVLIWIVFHIELDLRFQKKYVDYSGDSAWIPAMHVACIIGIDLVAASATEDGASVPPRKRQKISTQVMKTTSLMIHLCFEKGFKFLHGQKRIFNLWHAAAREVLPRSLLNHEEYKNWLKDLDLKFNDDYASGGLTNPGVPSSAAETAAGGVHIGA